MTRTLPTLALCTLAGFLLLLLLSTMQGASARLGYTLLVSLVPALAAWATLRLTGTNHPRWMVVATYTAWLVVAIVLQGVLRSL